jgi:hypothetical protein
MGYSHDFAGNRRKVGLELKMRVCSFRYIPFQITSSDHIIVFVLELSPQEHGNPAVQNGLHPYDRNIKSLTRERLCFDGRFERLSAVT